MIAAAFDYLRPSTVESAIDALAEAGEEAKVLAGGQSLLPILRWRLATPGLLVDLGGLPQLRGVRADDGYIVIGAMTTHAAVAASQLVRRHAELLALAAAKAGDRQVRHLGTLGGALAHADPAADIPAAAVALDARVVLAGPSGRRAVCAAEFAIGRFGTVLDPEEVLIEVCVPLHDGWVAHYEKFAPMQQSWATVGIAVTAELTDGMVAHARIALTGMGPTPVSADAAEIALIGMAPTADVVAAAAGVVDDGTAPPTDLSGSADYRRHLARVLTERALLAAFSERTGD
jgi:carbon-monoxide dehydrogenase medium subunit